MTYRYNTINNLIKINNIKNEVKDQRSKEIYKDLYNYIESNISKDIDRIENEEIKYLLNPFKTIKSNIRDKDMTNSSRVIFAKINKDNEIKLITYVEKNKRYFNKILEFDYENDSEYEYYQSKLDWYTVTPERINNFVKDLVDASEGINSIIRWIEKRLDDGKYGKIVNIEEKSVSYKLKI